MSAYDESDVFPAAEAILANFNPPDDRHRTWWIDPGVSARAVLDAVVPAIAARALREAAEAIDADFRDNVNDVALNDEADRIISARAFGMYRASRLTRRRADEIERAT